LSLLDTWLQRISHIAQFGLFLLTAGMIYFTVIPLYQKALLDEQIAQREIELARLQEDLVAAYAKIRSSIVRDFVFQAGVQCSGLMLPIDRLEPLSTSPSSKQNGHLESVLAISPEKCLTQELSVSALKELKPQDKGVLLGEVSRIGRTLEEARKVALAQFAKAAETAKTKPHSMPSTGTAKAVAEYVLANESLEFQNDVLSRIAVDRERAIAVAQYRDKIQSELLSIRNIRWPASESSGL